MFRDKPRSRAIALIGFLSTIWSRRTFAIVSTINIPRIPRCSKTPASGKLLGGQYWTPITPVRGQYSTPVHKHDLTQINETVLAQYWEWRQSPASTLDHPNAREKASSSTLYMERDTLNQFFKWCERESLIRRRPQIEMPVKLVRNRRPAFAVEEYRRLCRKMRSWCREHEKPDLVYQREMVRHFVLFSIQSGLRPKETKSLKWKHLSTFTSNDGIELLLVHVHPLTKTGERQCVPMPGALRTIERWREMSKYVGDDDYVFANYWGEFYRALERPVNKLLEYAGLRKDNFDRNRTAYSFRHTYATFRLLYGVNVDVYVLARNMGTSVEMIEKHYGHVVPQQQADMLTSMRVVNRPRKEIFNDGILAGNVVPFPQR